MYRGKRRNEPIVPPSDCYFPDSSSIPSPPATDRPSNDVFVNDIVKKGNVGELKRILDAYPDLVRAADEVSRCLCII